MIIDKEAQEKIRARVAYQFAGVNNLTSEGYNDSLRVVGEQIMSDLKELGYCKLEYRQCPECNSIWVCWNWIQSDDKKFWVHECWDCSNYCDTPDKVGNGMPYDFLRTQHRPLLSKDKAGL